MICFSITKCPYLNLVVETNGFLCTLKSKSELEEYFKPNNESRFTMLEMGKVLEKVSASVSEHFTTSPKQYTDATLLSAMETAGNTDYVEDSNVEKKRTRHACNPCRNN